MRVWCHAHVTWETKNTNFWNKNLQVISYFSWISPTVSIKKVLKLHQNNTEVPKPIMFHRLA